MSISLLLSVLVGLVFTWSLLSLATMNIQEWLASRQKWRSRMLQKTLAKLLTDKILLDQFYNHPLIRSLFTGKDNQDKPSYIPAGQFSQVIIDILATTGTEASLLQHQLYQLDAEAQKLSGKKRKVASHRISLLLGMTRKALVSEGGEDAVSSIMETAKYDLLSLQTKIPRLKEPIDKAFETVRTQKQEINDALLKLAYQEKPSANGAVNKIRAGIVAMSTTHPQLKQTLYAILHTASQTIWQSENELDLIRTNIEDWFNNSMTRLTGSYKRRVMASTFVISLLVAIFANIDTLHIADRIWHEPELRNLILNQTGSLLPQTETLDSGSKVWFLIQQQVSAAGLPIGWMGGLASPSNGDVLPVSSLGLNSRDCTLSPAREDQVFGLWFNQRCYRVINAPRFNDSAAWLIKCLGLLLTAAAASQGAPFWFDLLKKIVNVRLTGLNPSEAQKAFG